jgi:hypothetical protein
MGDDGSDDSRTKPNAAQESMASCAREEGVTTLHGCGDGDEDSSRGSESSNSRGWECREDKKKLKAKG